ncbi:hypothetical protein, partial [Burkholderia gladioli]|uniref:hypothetical protein n=1 Tax=Burkholderia gladioli TaxID=28095 RepID=UPI001ABA44D9
MHIKSATLRRNRNRREFADKFTQSAVSSIEWAIATESACASDRTRFFLLLLLKLHSIKKIHDIAIQRGRNAHTVAFAAHTRFVTA